MLLYQGKKAYLSRYAFALCCGMAAALPVYPSFAAEHPPASTIDRAQLMLLAKRFVNTVGERLVEADAYLANLDPTDIRRQAYFNNIADGEPMIFQISMTKKIKDEVVIRLDQPVSGIKEGKDVMLSLADFVSASSFPIHVHPDLGTADGWFIREKQKFHLDLNTRTVTSNGQTFKISEQEARIENGDIFVKGASLAQWMGFGLSPDPQAQFLHVATVQAWPAQEKYTRELRTQNRYKDGVAQLPFREDRYQKISSPNIDVNLRQTLTRSDSTQRTLSTTSYNVQATADVAGFQTKSTISGDKEEKINNVFATFSRSSENADLLGPLKASFYEFNDVQAVNVPFTSAGGGMERGIHVTNKNPFITTDTQTEIAGDAPPGWDVELYRGGQFLDSQVVGSDGRYQFSNVVLYAGENKLEVVKYGYQGQIQTEDRTLSVQPASYSSGGAYNVSLTQTGANTYSSSESSSLDKDTPHFAATYETQVAPTLSLQHGINALQENKNKNVYLYNGAVAVLDGTIINMDTGVSSAGAYQLGLTGRRNFGDQSVIASTQYRSEGYGAVKDSPAVYSLSTQATGPIFKNIYGYHSTYTANANLTRNDSGLITSQSGLNLMSRVGPLFVNNNLIYQTHWGREPQQATFTPTFVSSNTNDGLSGSFSLRGRYMGAGWRTSADYRVTPDLELERYLLDVTRNLTPQLQSQATIAHDLSGDVTSGQLALNWNAKHYILSPTVSYDSDGAFSMFVNLNFGLMRDPYTRAIAMSGTAMTDKGGVSAFVFLDKNGDGIFSKGDEPLEDVVVEAKQASITVPTNKKGQAFLGELSMSTITDISIQESSSFDVNWLPSFLGNSIRPRPGHVARMNFPVVRGSEMDGTTYVEDAQTVAGKRTLRDVHVNMYDSDGTMVRSALAASDGYYLFERIPPGHYWLMINGEDANASRVVRPAPQEIVFDYEGTRMLGNNIVANLWKEEGNPFNVPFFFRSVNKPVKPSNWVKTEGPNDIVRKEYFMRLGPYHSKLAMTFAWYKFKIRSQGWSDYFEQVEPVADEKKAQTYMTLKPTQPIDLGNMVQACRALHNLKFDCAVEIVSYYKEKQPPVTAAVADKKSKNSL